MKVAIYSQFPKKHSIDSTKVLIDTLLQYKTSIFIEEAFFKAINKDFNFPFESKTFSELDDSFDLLVSIGGDGTILRAITYVKNLNIPIIGINTGRLGFLATIQHDEIEDAIKHIFDKNYTLSKRSLLSLETS